MARSGKDDLKTPEYRSPQRVLVRVFENSRDLWKAKYQTLQERIKEFRTEVCDLRRSLRDRWRTKAEALQQQTKELRSQLQRQAEQSPRPRRGSGRTVS